jgi:hypothetical protein
MKINIPMKEVIILARLTKTGYPHFLDEALVIYDKKSTYPLNPTSTGHFITHQPWAQCKFILDFSNMSKDFPGVFA